MGHTVESATRYPGTIAELSAANEARASGVSWAAVTGGAFVAAELSLILLALGAGLGLSSFSIFSDVRASALGIGIAAIVRVIVVQIIGSSMGRYLANRLRTRRGHVHTDEVCFAHPAHGLLACAVAFVITSAFLASAATALAGSARVFARSRRWRGYGWQRATTRSWRLLCGYVVPFCHSTA